MEKIITLKPASELDDIQCKDGELEDADYLFGEDEGHGKDTIHTLRVRDAVRIPPGAEFLAVHEPEEGVRNIIIRLADGMAAWFDIASHLLGVSGAVKAAGAGEWLTILTRDTLHYARWNGIVYDIYGSTPAPPAARISGVAAALPPYSYTADEPPQIDITVSIGDTTPKEVLDWLAGTSTRCPVTVRENITAAVRESLAAFLNAANDAGLHLSPVESACAWQLHDGTLWQQSAAELIVSPRGGNDGLSLAITAAECNEGRLYMKLSLSRTPFAVSAYAPPPPSPWGNIIRGTAVVEKHSTVDINADYISSPVWLNLTTRGFMAGNRRVEDTSRDIDNVMTAMDAEGLPDNIFSIGGKMLAVVNRGEYGKSLILTSATSLPMVCAGTGEVAGNGIIHITQSLRSLSSGQLGEFPLYAFCRDGIRALTPTAGSYRDVQLISRDVALGRDSFAPLPNSTCFITKGGVMQISGTNIKCLSIGFNREFDGNDRLLFLYRENALGLYRPGETEVLFYSFNSGEWHIPENGPAEGITAHHYAWPDTMVQSGITIGEAAAERPADAADGRAGAIVQTEEAILVTTRPIKLTNAFDLKKLTEVEAEWPDGSRHAVRVYGALRLGRWYFLGLAPHGHMMMRGSGWRFFRFSTYATKSCGTYQLPQLRCKF